MPCKPPLRSRILWRSVQQRPLSIPSQWRQPTSPWLAPRTNDNQRRAFGLSSIPTVLLPPVVFTGLLITLWTYKCLMMIIFQNKIIYMPSMPPFSRSEKLEDYAKICKPVTWTEHSIKSGDGTSLKLLEGKAPLQSNLTPVSNVPRRQVVVVYFQGNGSSLPPRLPYISSILKLLQRPETETQYIVVALSYRGFWRSKGRPSQKGIELDAQAALAWVAEQYAPTPNMETKIVLWGQSIGAGVATTALATWQDHGTNVAGLLLETPFTSLRAMLVALYPQKFLPYRYLGPFLMSRWDSVAALSRIGKRMGGVSQITAQNGEQQDASRLKVLLLEAENDELVPKEDAAALHRLCRGFENLEAEHKVVTGALHTDVMIKSAGKREIVRFLRSFEGSK